MHHRPHYLGPPESHTKQTVRLTNRPLAIFYRLISHGGTASGWLHLPTAYPCNIPVLCPRTFRFSYETPTTTGREGRRFNPTFVRSGKFPEIIFDFPFPRSLLHGSYTYGVWSIRTSSSPPLHETKQPGNPAATGSISGGFISYRCPSRPPPCPKTNDSKRLAITNRSTNESGHLHKPKSTNSPTHRLGSPMFFICKAASRRRMVKDGSKDAPPWPSHCRLMVVQLQLPAL
ncbi:hypothetical protein SODALDRAFT_360346 [Sodiomyces alkalinus F11]|uniref:Uncharacterized protein n=1 Tax=Sodiomyces alkalinus (strain CBS 110278 / VKM F-3762 / F11) TaxID=1314773 RepID=A0A3N2PU89_SODAK|nr:hypothetical protein SODALDRAFT_360346 [Sodiomyces alkalinus F11]ROT38024.1 hypothetical protein SODALDRAFT_360346 [Sodiomyces alkalinus F11]